MNFIQLLKKKYGNPRAQWAQGKLSTGQKVRILIHDPIHDNRFVDAIATGKKRKGKNEIRYKDSKNRTWIIPVDNENILVEW
jgi:hypothetical protein